MWRLLEQPNNRSTTAVEWTLNIGCGFSGFLVELLGIASALSEELPELCVLGVGECSEDFYTRQLFPKEADALRRLTTSCRRDFVGMHEECPTSENVIVSEDYDLVGGDLPRGEVDFIRPSMAACCQACVEAGSDLCAGWTYRDGDGSCFLKGPLPHWTGVHREGLTSGVVAQLHPHPQRRVVVIHGRCSPDALRRRREEEADTLFVARLMSETSQLRGNADSVFLCASNVDDLWVPTTWHAEVFAKHGIAREKIAVIPEAVDATLFDPALVVPPPPTATEDGTCRTFKFLSIFKWERRKGWHALLEAYWRAFANDDDVVLQLRTWLPPWESGPRDLNVQISEFAWAKFQKPLSSLPAVEWLGEVNGYAEELSRVEIRELLAGADSFVLPTRGEGWGLPVAEAMAMSRPVIVTNFSGPTAFIDDENAYPLPYALGADGFANPDIAALVDLMRRVVDDTASGEAAARGRRAREEIMRWSPQLVAAKIAERLRWLTQKKYPPIN